MTKILITHLNFIKVKDKDKYNNFIFYNRFLCFACVKKAFCTIRKSVFCENAS